MVCYEEARIRILNMQAITKQKEDLFHEMLRAIFRERNYWLPDDKEEIVCQELSRALNAFCVDNGIEFWEQK